MKAAARETQVACGARDKASLRDHLFEVAVGGGDDAHVHLDRVLLGHLLKLQRRLVRVAKMQMRFGQQEAGFADGLAVAYLLGEDERRLALFAGARVAASARYVLTFGHRSLLRGANLLRQCLAVEEGRPKFAAQAQKS